MATVHPLRVPAVPAETDEGVVAPLRRLIRLEIELALAEARDLVVKAATAIALGLVGAFLFIAALIVLLAAALAPLFAAPWEHLVIAGGSAAGVAAAVLGWTAWRLTHLAWPKVTLTSLEETWRWLEAQMKSRLRFQ